MREAYLRLPRRSLLALALTAAAGAASGCTRPRWAGGVGPVLTVRDATLRWQGRAVQALGGNIWQLQDYFCPGAPPFTAGGATWYPVNPGPKSHALDILKTAAAYGLNVMRIIAGGWNPAWLHYWQTNPTAWWQGHDEMMDAAASAGIHLIPSLVWHALPFSVATGETDAQAFTPGSRGNALMLEFAKQYVGHYRDHPAVLMWEVGNEWNLQTGRGGSKEFFATVAQLDAFLARMVDTIRSVDPNHLTTSGSASPAVGTGPGAGISLDQQREAFIAINRHVDVACVHVYPDTQLLTAEGVGLYLRTMAEAARSELKKPLIVGEFGESYIQDPRATFVRQVLDTWSAGTFPVALVWSWMAASNSGPGQLSLSIDPTLRPAIADLFKSYATKHPWPPSVGG